jgi:hypothetical protein
MENLADWMEDKFVMLGTIVIGLFGLVPVVLPIFV